jgi:hypothetical protein
MKKTKMISLEKLNDLYYTKDSMVKGGKHSEETKEKLRLANIRRAENGWQHTPEAIEKIREAGKRRVGMKFSEEHRKNMSLSRKGTRLKENSPSWKGDKVSYRGLHYWVESVLGKPFKCAECGIDKVPEGKIRWFDWANVSGLYLREPTDWIRLCKVCHRKQEKELIYKRKLL